MRMASSIIYIVCEISIIILHKISHKNSTCRYLISGDADGKLYIWDWKTTKLYSKFKAHDDVCIQAIWHPHETSKVATAGWDGVIKFWD
ncbi:hypothetical protein DPMN_050063 [Dreissena polymorpha]|uniref:Uncharacterized protein n=1 Tax=Dreissena polymorpha TaxID=45954 RepID=A0A9D4CFE9_DREPO|nr:hypothetical protein DPMN_050063 [Dreissena polymorpha]